MHKKIQTWKYLKFWEEYKKMWRFLTWTLHQTQFSHYYHIGSQSLHPSNRWWIHFLCLCLSYPWRNWNIKEKVVRKLHYLVILVINLVFFLNKYFYIISYLVSHVSYHFSNSFIYIYIYIIRIIIIFYTP